MSTIEQIGAFRVQFLPADGPQISDAGDIIGDAWAADAQFIVVPVQRLDPEFFRLASLVAGDILQKIVNYRLRIAIIGDISAHVAQSDALRDFVWESNRGQQVWFVADLDELRSRLDVSGPA